MIAFRCPQCTQKFEVKEEFAGRQSRCPACKHALVVPMPAAPAAAPDRIDGTASSLARAGINPSLTLPIVVTPGNGHATSARSVADVLGRGPSSNERYLVEGEIARGGMGAVMRAVDCDIRREVAIKYLLDQNDPRRKLRFVEEAQITGQLEHPNIVPIHELGIDAQKRLFFAMRMVRGRSLAQVLEGLRTNARDAEREYPLARLLNILVNVCHAVAYAHSRNVIHRDLKPANIMLGDFGEVYIMDWGLARVLSAKPPAPPMATLAPNAAAAPMATMVTGPAVAAPAALPLTVPVAAPASAAPIPTNTAITSGKNSKVVTSRSSEADLTQDGAVLGTPAYMPPEQAMGHMHNVDERSDVYALGAILYEMLTLKPPVDAQGDYLAVLMRVSQGEIQAPEQRTPERARKGKIPRELAAVAMKALAFKSAERYPSADELRRDIERFQEGRSVSAKGDSALEMTWKLMKRNKGASAGVALALLALLVGLGVSFRSWLKAETAYAAYRKEQDAKRAQAQQSVPAFVAAARMSVESRNYTDAIAQVGVALDYEPENTDARLLRAQLQIVRRDFGAARADLQQYLRLQPDDVSARKLNELCERSDPEEAGTLLAFAAVLNELKSHTLADGLLTRYGPDSIAARKQLLGVYQKRIDKAWPGYGRFMHVDDNGVYSLYLVNNQRPTDLTPLQGIPLTSLSLEGSRVTDLSPLRGMPLTALSFWGCPVTDLKPLQGMRLQHLNMNRTKVSDLSPLRSMPLKWLSLAHCAALRDLGPLQGMPLEQLELGDCGEVRDLTPLQGLPLTKLGLHGCGQVRDLSPLAGMKLVALSLDHCSMRDLSPLRGMPLTTLSMQQCSQVADLSPLRGMPLARLSLFFCTQVRDLSPLEGMKLASLDLRGCAQIRDLTPIQALRPTTLDLGGCSQLRDLSGLRGMPLTALNLDGCTALLDFTPLGSLKLTDLNAGGCHLQDLTPLRGMPLTSLTLNGCPVQDLSGLRGMPLTHLRISNCGALRDLSGLAGMPLTSLEMWQCPKIEDVTPLASTTLIELNFTPKYVTRGMDRLRQLKSLKTIHANFERFSADEFWRRYDAGDFKK
jgi:serine/threonine protein kinase/Leucine-rich repeat (LRR) protein